jgi:hypothetical protein
VLFHGGHVPAVVGALSTWLQQHSLPCAGAVPQAAELVCLLSAWRAWRVSDTPPAHHLVIGIDNNSNGLNSVFFATCAAVSGLCVGELSVLPVSAAVTSPAVHGLERMVLCARLIKKGECCWAALHLGGAWVVTAMLCCELVSDWDCRPCHSVLLVSVCCCTWQGCYTAGTAQ